MIQQIQGTPFEKRCIKMPSARNIVIYQQGCDNAVVEVCKPNGGLPVIRFDGDWCDAYRARKIAQALQLAATIASDFDTWFSE